MDILQPLPVDKWPLLRKITKENWPTYAYYYTWITNAVRLKKKDPEFKVNIFCPNGNYESGVFVGIFSPALHIIAVFSLKKSKELLKKALLETKIIDWNQKALLFGATHEDFSDVLLDFLNLKKGTHEFHSDVTVNFFKPKEECLNLQFHVPDECKLGYLDTSHVELIHSVWPHRLEKYPELTTGQLKSYLTANRGIGLFLKKDNTLVSWIMQTDWGGLGILQTLEEHKRKGYGKVVTQALVKELAEQENLDSIAFVVDRNIPSKKLFGSLDYKAFAKNTWVLMIS